MLGRFWRWLTRSGRNTAPAGQAPARVGYMPMAKHYVFNETGNIMLCATADSIQDFDKDIRDSFMDVSVFFTAMTKAVHSTVNPATGKPFSIYNYQAVKNILNQSGMFIETNVEEGVFCSRGVGAPMGKDFIQTVLNRDFSESRLPFARAMFNGMGYQKVPSEKWKKLNQSEQKLCRSGNIFFVGELLMGLPQTSAILVSIEPHSINKETGETDADRQNIFGLGIKNETEHEHRHKSRYWIYKKRTYLFVPPRFFKHNVSALKAPDSQEFEDYVDFLAGRLEAAATGQIQSGTE